MSLLRSTSIIADTLRHALADRLRGIWRTATTRQRKLRIGIDIRPFYEPLTGVGWYLHAILHELARYDDVELYLLGDARIYDSGPRLHADVPANAKLVLFDFRGIPHSRIAHQLSAGAYVLLIKLIGCDVMFAANYFLPRLHAAVARRRVITIHDLTFKRFPELLQKETLDNLSRQMQREIAVADAIICVSESTRRDLLQFYALDPRRAVTILSGLATPVTPAPIAHLPERYLLFVSTVEPRKNLAALLDAYERMRADGSYDGSLVVVGKIGWKSEAIARRLKGPGVVHLHYVAAAQLATVYQHAEVFVFPSLYEGFGFPLLEAMAHAVPTVAARSSSLPEIGGDATLFFEPRDVDGLVTQLHRVLNDRELRDQLIARGREQAAKFRWDVAAKKTLEVLRQAAS
jgi:glycosyltransferase involved in cell wall biosynthesis